MNQPWPEMDLVLLSNALWLLATITVVLAAVGVVGFVALAFAEWKRAASRADPRAHTNLTSGRL